MFCKWNVLRGREQSKGNIGAVRERGGEIGGRQKQNVGVVKPRRGPGGTSERVCTVAHLFIPLLSLHCWRWKSGPHTCW